MKAEMNNRVAVGLFMWRRKTNLRRIIDEIKTYKPLRLYLFWDGPRNDSDKTEIEAVKTLCEEALLGVDFEVIADAAPTHWGLNKRFRTGLHRLFSAEPMAIVLEDDTIPSPSFFSYCTFFLNEFQDRNDIVAINGFFKARTPFIEKYALSKPFTNFIFNPWGWASWSHKFLPLYNPDIKTITFFQALKVFSLWWNFDLYRLRRRLLRMVETGELHTWDVQLQWSLFLAQKKVLTPPVNLIENVGNDTLASTFVAGSSDFEQKASVLQNSAMTDAILHFPQYDLELCRSKSNWHFIKKNYLGRA